MLGKQMDVNELLNLLTIFDHHGIEVIIDGGWGVDALLGKQTRIHKDLDIALEHKHVPRVRKLLNERGYEDVYRDDTRECNFVLGDDKGHEVDVHSYTFDEQGNNIFGVAYPLASLKGIGKINNYFVKCISVEWMIKFHSGYVLSEKDYHDVSLLCKHFNIPLPDEYKKFVK